MPLFKSIVLLTTLAWLVAGCSQSNTASDTARNGGTMMLSLGSFEELGHVNISKSDLTASVTDTNTLEVSVKVREVFPLSADKTSAISTLESDESSGGTRNGYSGFWLAVVDLVDANSSQTTNLAPGMATLKVAGLAAPVIRSVEILPGAGTINPVMEVFGINTLNMLNPAQQVKYWITDPGTTFTEANMLGALEFQFLYSASNVSGIEASQWPRVVSATNDEKLQISSYTKTDGATNTLYVTVLNPAGMGRATDANKNAESFYRASEIDAIRFSVVYPPQVGPAPFSNPTSTTGYDTGGTPVNISALSIVTPTI